MARTQSRAYISKDVRRDLWIAAAGRCEFRGCCKPIDRDFLTKARCVVGEYAHIIGDSPDAARGVAGESERLAADQSNLMLACFDCHSRIDRNGKNNEFTAEELGRMKREHEARVELIYSATGVKESLPILMSFPVGKHVPVVDIQQVQYALLKNSSFTRFPVAQHIYIDKSDFDVHDDSTEFWPLAERAVSNVYEQRIRPQLTSRSGVPHLTIAAFAPIPMLMKLGALIGDKTEATVLDLPVERWLWDKNPDCPSPEYVFDVPDTLPREVAAVVSISGRAVAPEHMKAVEFRAVSPNRGIIRNEAHLLHFRQQFNVFLTKLTQAGVRVLHIHPATPLSASVEIGRTLLPKIFEEVHAWEWRAPDWKLAVRLK
ncbi:MAG: SAVED domain-containing protein [Janthinobacterium lividum]